ncbi:hypothetical protein DM2_213 [Halorubrum sp. DM2]|uniref:hypothetical protein n=1 Tax=Halorubrum sp. DM2 TaxID=2527867 RepID=UPI0024B74552|nr:hypothetical protein [Halorubrum sp. DM2]VTT85331.1 hypothetical protein DM2_213 [Halorubrum sp. DM2]
MAGEGDAVAADRSADRDRAAIDDVELDDDVEPDDDTDAFDEDLWLDRISRKLGMGWLSDMLPGNIPPSYLYAVVTITTLELVVGAYSYAMGEPIIYLQNPFFVFQPIALLAAVYGSRSLRRRYYHVMKEMRIDDRVDESERLTDIIPSWLPWTVFLSALAINYIRMFALGGPITIYREMNLAAVIGWTVSNPVWASIATQFFAVYLSVELIAPRRLRNSDVGIDFLDPEGLGGLRPIGELIKHAYYYVVAGLIAFALLLYGPAIIGIEMERTAATNIVFTAIWAGSIATVGYAVFTLHRFMRDEKRHELRRLKSIEQRLVENRWDIKRYVVSGEDRDTVEELRRRMEMVSSTNEYPATFSIWSQLLLSIIIPKATQLLVARI